MDAESLRTKNKQNISDGYHTFRELYDHRHALFIVLANSNSQVSWKSLKHNDGSSYPGWFIAGMELPSGPITYHLPLIHWKKLKIKKLETAPEWDGHTSKDVIMRLFTTAQQWQR